MAKVFCAWDVDQGWLLPPLLHEFVPPAHMGPFVRDTVREAPDLTTLLDSYRLVRSAARLRAYPGRQCRHAMMPKAKWIKAR